MRWSNLIAPGMLELPKSPRHAIVLGVPFLVFGMLGVTAGVMPFFKNTSPYTMYHWILLGLGIPSLVLGTMRFSTRSGVVIDRESASVLIWSHLFWWRRETERDLADFTMVVRIKFWNPSKTESAYLYRVVLRADDGAGDLLLETRLSDEDGKAYAARVSEFLELPVVEEKKWG